VARQIARVTFLPAIAGFLVRRFLPGVAARIGNPLRVLANILLIILVLMLAVLLAIAPDLRAMLNPGGPAVTAIVLMVVFSLAAGHFLGGPTQEKRAVLAVASIARNVGLALFIAGLSDYGQKFVPTLLTYMILGGLLAVPYAVWSKRRVKLQSATGR
jgi:BASS family bile acid:Na+ symporter